MITINKKLVYKIVGLFFNQQRKLLETVLFKASETFRVLFSNINNHFELCLAKCRTNSQSVQHENAYLKSNKHCYTTADKLP